MAITYNNLHVDEAYSDKLEANLYYQSIMVPGVTFDDSHTKGPGGAVYVHRLSVGAVMPGVPGRDFEDTDLTDELIPIKLNNCFQRSRKIYGVQAAAVGADLKDQVLTLTEQEIQGSWEAAAVACLVNEGSASEDTTTPTTENARDLVVDVRAEIIAAGGTPDVVLCSPAFYALILKTAGKEFLPVTNEAIAATGNVGTFLGMTWVEASVLGKTGFRYYDSSSTFNNVLFGKVDFVVYSHSALSAVTNVETARLVDSESFVGSKAQVEVNTGYKVRDNQLVKVHRHA